MKFIPLALLAAFKSVYGKMENDSSFHLSLHETFD